MSRNKESTAILNGEEKSKFDVEIKVEEESSSALRMESLSYVILSCQYAFARESHDKNAKEYARRS